MIRRNLGKPYDISNQGDKKDIKMKKLLLLLFIANLFSQAISEHLSIFTPNTFNNALGESGVSSQSIYEPFYNPAAPFYFDGLYSSISIGYRNLLPNFASDYSLLSSKIIFGYSDSLDDKKSKYQILFSRTGSLWDLGEWVKSDDYGNPSNFRP